jgi:hypothetical protein
MQPGTSSTVASIDIGVLVFREGLECILVLAAITASLTGSDQAHRRPVAIGAGMGFVATLVTWFIAIEIVGQLTEEYSSARLASSDRPGRGHCSARDYELVFPQNLLGRLDSGAYPPQKGAIRQFEWRKALTFACGLFCLDLLPFIAKASKLFFFSKATICDWAAASC